MPQTRLHIAKPDIIKAFSERPPVLSESMISSLLQENRAFWRLTRTLGTRPFIDFLLKHTPLRKLSIPLPRRPVSGYVWGDVPLMEGLQGLIPRSYFSHYTALRLHGLTEQVPKTLYLTQEKLRPRSRESAAPLLPMDQAAIDTAFLQPPRLSSNVAELPDEGLRVMLLEGADHGNFGVIEHALNLGGTRLQHLRYTNLERTLIDCAVRPFYAGGVAEVLKAFRQAREQLSVNALNATYRKLGLAYPYHQAIGFYLEQAGYPQNRVALFRRHPIERDFYLTHQMGRTTYVAGWRLYVPEGMDP